MVKDTLLWLQHMLQKSSPVSISDLKDGFIFIQLLSVIHPSYIDISDYTSSLALTGNIIKHNFDLIYKTCASIGMPIDCSLFEQGYEGNEEALRIILESCKSEWEKKFSGRKEAEENQSQCTEELIDIEIQDPTFFLTTRYLISFCLSNVPSAQSQIKSELELVSQKLRAQAKSRAFKILPTPIPKMLTNTSLYQLVASIFFPDKSSPPTSLTNDAEDMATDFIDVLINQKVMNIKTDLTANVKEMVRDSEVFYESVHFTIHSNILSYHLYSSSGLPSLPSLKSHLQIISAYKQKPILPFDLEDGYLVWISTVLRERNHSKCEMDDLVKDTIHFHIMQEVFRYYFPNVQFNADDGITGLFESVGMEVPFTNDDIDSISTVGRSRGLNIKILKELFMITLGQLFLKIQSRSEPATVDATKSRKLLKVRKSKLKEIAATIPQYVKRHDSKEVLESELVGSPVDKPLLPDAGQTDSTIKSISDVGSDDNLSGLEANFLSTDLPQIVDVVSTEGDKCEGYPDHSNTTSDVNIQEPGISNHSFGQVKTERSLIETSPDEFQQNVYERERLSGNQVIPASDGVYSSAENTHEGDLFAINAERNADSKENTSVSFFPSRNDENVGDNTIGAVNGDTESISSLRISTVAMDVGAVTSIDQITQDDMVIESVEESDVTEIVPVSAKKDDRSDLVCVKDLLQLDSIQDGIEQTQSTVYSTNFDNHLGGNSSEETEGQEIPEPATNLNLSDSAHLKDDTSEVDLVADYMEHLSPDVKIAVFDGQFGPKPIARLEETESQRLQSIANLAQKTEINWPRLSRKPTRESTPYVHSPTESFHQAGPSKCDNGEVDDTCDESGDMETKDSVFYQPAAVISQSVLEYDDMADCTPVKSHHVAIDSNHGIADNEYIDSASDACSSDASLSASAEVSDQNSTLSGWPNRILELPVLNSGEECNERVDDGHGYCANHMQLCAVPNYGENAAENMQEEVEDSESDCEPDMRTYDIDEADIIDGYFDQEDSKSDLDSDEEMDEEKVVFPVNLLEWPTGSTGDGSFDSTTQYSSTLVAHSSSPPSAAFDKIHMNIQSSTISFSDVASSDALVLPLINVASNHNHSRSTSSKSTGSTILTLPPIVTTGHLMSNLQNDGKLIVSPDRKVVTEPSTSKSNSRNSSRLSFFVDIDGKKIEDPMLAQKRSKILKRLNSDRKLASRQSDVGSRYDSDLMERRMSEQAHDVGQDDTSKSNPQKDSIPNSSAHASRHKSPSQKSQQHPTKSNKQLIRNALTHVCLAGAVNQKVKDEVLRDIENCGAENFMILFKDTKNHSFKALYTFDVEMEQVKKLYGFGPNQLTTDDIQEYYKYDSGSRGFKNVPTKSFSRAVHAVAILGKFERNRK